MDFRSWMKLGISELWGSLNRPPTSNPGTEKPENSLNFISGLILNGFWEMPEIWYSCTFLRHWVNFWFDLIRLRVWRTWKILKSHIRGWTKRMSAKNLRLWPLPPLCPVFLDHFDMGARFLLNPPPPHPLKYRRLFVQSLRVFSTFLWIFLIFHPRASRKVRKFDFRRFLGSLNRFLTSDLEKTKSV